MAAKGRGLGKGLDALIPSAQVPAKTKEETAKDSGDTGKEQLVKITKVEPNREQPRKNFDEDALEELADSIKQFGLLQPILVQDRKTYYEIIAGERRWRAAKLAGLKEVPVIIKNFTPQEIVEISLIENIQREDLNPIEEALAYKRLLTEFRLTQDEVEKLVKSIQSPKPKKEPQKTNPSLELVYREIEERLKQSLGTKVSIQSKENGAGKMEIEFFSHEELERITEFFMKKSDH